MLVLLICLMILGIGTIVNNIFVLKDDFVKSYSYITYPLFIIYSISLAVINIYLLIDSIPNLQEINKTIIVLNGIILFCNWIDILTVEIKIKHFHC